MRVDPAKNSYAGKIASLVGMRHSETMRRIGRHPKIKGPNICGPNASNPTAQNGHRIMRIRKGYYGAVPNFNNGVEAPNNQRNHKTDVKRRPSISCLYLVPTVSIFLPRSEAKVSVIIRIYRSGRSRQSPEFATGAAVNITTRANPQHMPPFSTPAAIPHSARIAWGEDARRAPRQRFHTPLLQRRSHRTY